MSEPMDLHPSARCARVQKTCCQRTEILVTEGDRRRFAACVGREDFWERRDEAIIRLMLETGARIGEVVAMTTDDIDLTAGVAIVRRGKGRKDRMTLLPANLVSPLQEHLRSVAQQHHTDLQMGAGYVELPEALSRKYPNASKSKGSGEATTKK